MTKPPLNDDVASIPRTSQVFRAAGLVASLALLSRLLGLLREVVIRQFLGVVTVEATAFDIASRLPETIFLVVAGGAIGAAFIPTFTAYFARRDEAGGWRLFSAVINIVLIVTTILSLLAMILARPFVLLTYGEVIAEEPTLLPLTVYLMRIMLLSPIIFGVSGVVMAALNARQHFLLPALAPSIYNIGIILGGVAGAVIGGTPFAIVTGLAWGTVLGALGHLLIQLPGLRRQRARYQAVLDIRDAGVRQVMRLTAPRILGLSFSEINKFIILFLTGTMPLGTLPALNTAFRILIMPQGILGQALGIAAFPTLAALAARSAREEMRRIVSDSLRLVLFLGLPATVLLLLLAEPYVAVLFERGLFDAGATVLVATALRFYAVGLIALTAIEVVARAFYALSDTLTPVLVGALQIVAMWVLSLWLRDSIFPALGLLPLGGLSLGFSLSNIIEIVVLLWLLRRKMNGIDGRALLSGTARTAAASLAMAAGILVTLDRLPEDAALAQAVIGTLVGGALYLLAAWLLRVEELRRIIDVTMRRFRSGSGS